MVQKAVSRCLLLFNAYSHAKQQGWYALQVLLPIISKSPSCCCARIRASCSRIDLRCKEYSSEPRLLAELQYYIGLCLVRLMQSSKTRLKPFFRAESSEQAEVVKSHPKTPSIGSIDVQYGQQAKNTNYQDVMRFSNLACGEIRL